MTPEVKDAIYGILWGLVPYIVIALIVGAVLGIGIKLLEKKLIKWAKKKREQLDKKSNDR